MTRPLGGTEMYDQDHRGWQAQQAAELRLEACRAAYYHEDEHPAGEACDDCPPDVSSAPFDDCTTCCVREALAAAWPILAEMALTEYLTNPPGTEPSWRRL